MDALALAAVAIWSFAVSFGGGTVGMVLGNLRLPLIILVGSSPAAAAGANVAISGLAAISATTAHIRAGRMRWELFAWMAPASIAGAVTGGLISGALPDRILLGTISVIVLYGAYEVRKLRAGRVAQVEPTRARMIFEAGVIGFIVGLLGGIVGLILGTMRLPAMMRRLGIDPYDAVGTNSAVGVTVGLGGLVGHLPSGVDWELIAAGGLPAMVGAYLGARFTGWLDQRQLLLAISIVLVISGTAMALRAIFG